MNGCHAGLKLGIAILDPEKSMDRLPPRWQWAPSTVRALVSLIIRVVMECALGPRVSDYDHGIKKQYEI